MMTKIFHLGRTPHFFGCDPLELLWFWGSFACWWWWCIQHSLFSFWRIISIEGWGPSQIISFWAWHYSTAAASHVDYSLALAKPSLALICNWTFSYGNFLCSSIVVKEPEPEEESRGKIFTHAMPLSMLSFFFIYKPKNPKVIHSLLMHNCCFCCCVSRGLGLSHIM